MAGRQRRAIGMAEQADVDSTVARIGASVLGFHSLFAETGSGQHRNG